MMRKRMQYVRILAPLLSFLIPGAGHLILGLHMKGLLLLLGTLTDIAAMIRFANEGGGTYALLDRLSWFSDPVFLVLQCI